VKKNILITGVNGYIGLNLSNYLIRNGYNVSGIDKVFGNPAELLTGSNTLYIDAIVHLAALSGIKACEDNFEESIIDNISSAFNIFNLSHKFSTPVIFLSSQAAKDPKSSIYAMMKRTIEIQAEMLNRKTDSDIKVLRLTNIYGGVSYLEKKNTVVKKFIEAYKNKRQIIIDGDGSQTRDFIHVDDVCEYIMRCIRFDSGIKILEPVDIGTGEQTTINELARMFDNCNVEYDTDSRSVGVDTNYADITKAVEIFEYKAINRLEEYIDEILNKERN